MVFQRLGKKDIKERPICRHLGNGEIEEKKRRTGYFGHTAGILVTLLGQKSGNMVGILDSKFHV